MAQSKTVFLLKNRLGAHGGLEKYTWRIANAFSRKGCALTILTSDKVHKAHENPLLHFKRISTTKPFFSYKKIRQFDQNCFEFLRKHPADIIFGMDRNRFQTHIRAGNGVHRAFLEKRKLLDPVFKKLVMPLNPLHKTILSLEKKAFEHPGLKKLFTNSHMVKNEVLKYYNTDPKKVQVIHNGVEWYEMQKDFDGWIEKKAKVASSLHLDPTLFHFLFVGSGYKRKGLDLLLKALSILPQRDFHLSIIGKEKKISDYLELTKKLNLQNHVSFYGKRADITKFYQLADTLVIPSYYDPFANVTVEALAMGVYVISSPFNGGSEILTDSEGLVFDAMDADSLALCLKEAMNRPKTWLRSSEIRSKVKHLDFSHQIGNLVDSCFSS